MSVPFKPVAVATHFSGTVRGGSVWSTSTYAPAVQKAIKAEDVGTQGTLDSEVFLFSGVTKPSAGGERHEWKKQLSIAELGEVRKDRAHTLAKELDRADQTHRQALVEELGEASVLAVNNAVKFVTHNMPQMVQNGIKSLFTKTHVADLKQSEDEGNMLHKLCSAHASAGKRAGDLAIEARNAAQLASSEAKKAAKEARVKASADKGSGAAKDGMSGSTLIGLRVMVLRGCNLPKIANRVPEALVKVSMVNTDDDSKAPPPEETQPAQPSHDPTWTGEKMAYTLKSNMRRKERQEILMLEVTDAVDSDAIGTAFVPLKDYVRWRPGAAQGGSEEIGEWECQAKVWVALRSRDNKEIKRGLRESDGPAAIQISLSLEKSNVKPQEAKFAVVQRFIDDYQVPAAEPRPKPSWRDHPAWARVHAKSAYPF